MARFVSHLDSLLSLVLARTYSSSYLSLILAYSWSSSVILNTNISFHNFWRVIV